MKRFRIISAIALATVMAVGCSAVHDDGYQGGEILFQVARKGNTALTKADDYRSGYEDVPFGAYAWFKGATTADDANFMTNQKVTYNATDNVWSPFGTTYYWPKSGSLDFICYSPYSEAEGPAVTESSVSFNGWDMIAAPATDLMYADKMTGLTQNAITYYYNGVPVLFHHALSRVSFVVRLAYNEATPATGDKTKWEVTLNSVTLKNIRTKGNLALTLDGTGSWAQPDSGVWENDGTTADYAIDCSGFGTIGTDAAGQEIGNAFFVLPQMLDLGQEIAMNLTIRTWRDIGEGYPEEPFITENSIQVSASLGNATLSRWGINNSVTYNLVLAPSRSTDGENPAEVHFDPAVADWDTIVVNAEINI